MSRAPLSLVPVFLALVLHLTGCAPSLTPEARCFAEATVEYRAAWREAQALRADLARGYTLVRAEVGQVQAVPCRVEGKLSTCLHEGGSPLALPIPVDRPALEKRLATLDARMAALRPAAMERAAPCGYGDWADPTL